MPRNVAKIPVGGAQYSVLCREDGGVLDDLFTYRLEADRYPYSPRIRVLRDILAKFGGRRGKDGDRVR